MKPISGESVNDKMDERTPFLLGAVTTNLRYELLVDKLKQRQELQANKMICAIIDSQLYYLPPFFKDSFDIYKKPRLWKVVPTECNLDKAFPPTSTSIGYYYVGFISNETNETKLSGTNKLFRQLILTDKKSVKDRVYKASFKFHFKLNFKYDFKTNKPTCEVEIDIRVFLKKRDKWDDVWLAIKEDDFDKDAYKRFESDFNSSLRHYINDKLLTLGFLYEQN